MSTAAIAIGDIGDAEREQLQRAAARAEATITFQPSFAHAVNRVRHSACLFVDSHSDVASVIDNVRDDAALFALPVIVLADVAAMDVWQRAYAQGADDVVLKRDVSAITRRLLMIAQSQATERPEASLGRAVIASAVDASRRRVGRTLRSVGFDIAYAANVKEAVSASVTPAFVVTTEVAPPGSVHGVAYVSGVPVLFLGEQAAFAPVHDRITDATARILFFADEQARARFTDRRVSERRLWSVMCSFREAGALEPSYGMTHNISREGLYVRTLDPPKAGTPLWVEMLAPDTGHAVHLRANAVWQRLPGAKFGVVPPGFGLRLDPERCPQGDLEAYVAAYDALGR